MDGRSHRAESLTAEIKYLPAQNYILPNYYSREECKLQYKEAYA
jgi:hypothetical protein